MSTTSGRARSAAVTRLFSRIQEGDREAAEELLPLVYSELRALARARMAHEPAGHTLQPTALVHEAYLRLIGESDPGWKSRGHFFGAAARAMRRILVERARRVGRIRHGGELQRVALDEQIAGGVTVEQRAAELLDLDAALERLAERDGPMARMVELHFFGGLSIEDSARVLEVSPRTADRLWSGARAWLRLELQREAGEPDD